MKEGRGPCHRREGRRPFPYVERWRTFPKGRETLSQCQGKGGGEEMKKKEETGEEKEPGLASTPLPCSSDLNEESFKPGKEPPPGYEIHLSKSVDIRYFVITTTKQQTFEWPRPVEQVEEGWRLCHWRKG